MKLTNLEILNIKAMLDSLSGPYSFTTGASYAIALNGQRFAKAAELINDERNKIIKKLAPEGKTDLVAGDPNFDKCTEEVKKLSAIKTEIDAHKFDYDGLKVEENKISPAITSLLLPILNPPK